MSIPVTISVTVCSTCTRGLTSMKNHSPRIHIDEKLDRAGVVVAGGAGELDAAARHSSRRMRLSRFTPGATSTTF